MAEAGPEAEPSEAVFGEQRCETALPGRRAELDPRRQEQLAAGKPGRRVLELGDVDPANGTVGSARARDQLEAGFAG